MDVYFWVNFSKRENSSKQPSMQLAVKYECVLKEACSVVTPVLLVEHSPLISFKNFTYAYIPDFTRNYFVDDIVADGKLWVISMHVDVLATYRDAIASASLYIVRSSVRYNGLIADNHYPVTFDRRSMITESDTLWTTLSGSNSPNTNITYGVFVLGIISKPDTGDTGPGSYGSIKYFALTQAALIRLVTRLLENSMLTDDGFSATDATINLQKSLINPLGYIKSCMWLPINISVIVGTAATRLNVWDWNITGFASGHVKMLTGSTPYRSSGQVGITPHAHPQAATRGAYLNAAPYHRVSLLYPPFGLFEIDTTELVDNSTLAVMCTVDYITGLGQLDIMSVVPAGSQMTGSASAYNVLQRVKGQVGVSIQLSEVSYDYSNMGLNLIGFGAEAINKAFGEYLDSSISNALTQIGTAVNAMRTKQSTIGSAGGFAELAGKATLYEEFYMIADEDLDHIGRPLCEVRTLQGTGSGYYMVRDGEIEIPRATFGELTQVKSYLESGFFYE